MSVDPRPLVLIDGSNVAFNGTRRASLTNLESVLAVLETWPLRVTTLVDATLPHRIDRPRDLESLFHAGRVQQVPAGTSADDFLWQMARAGVAEGRVVLLLTNDRFPDTRSAEEGVLGIHRVTFLVTNGRPFFQPPLESLVSRVPPPPPSPALAPFSAPHRCERCGGPVVYDGHPGWLRCDRCREYVRGMAPA